MAHASVYFKFTTGRSQQQGHVQYLCRVVGPRSLNPTRYVFRKAKSK